MFTHIICQARDLCLLQHQAQQLSHVLKQGNLMLTGTLSVVFKKLILCKVSQGNVSPLHQFSHFFLLLVPPGCHRMFAFILGLFLLARFHLLHSKQAVVVVI